MADEDKTTKDDKTGGDDDKTKTDDKTSSKDQTPSIEDQIKEGIEIALKPIKENLDNAYAARDAALDKVKTYEDKEKDDELKRREG